MDAMLAGTGGNNIQDGLAIFFSKTSTESLQDAEKRWLLEAPQSATPGTIQDMWYEVTGNLGHTGALMDRLLKYWNTQ